MEYIIVAMLVTASAVVLFNNLLAGLRDGGCSCSACQTPCCRASRAKMKAICPPIKEGDDHVEA